MPFAATWMDLEIVILSELTHTEKEKSYDITYMWNLKKNDTNELITKQKQTHRLREQTYGYRGEGCQGGIVREFGIERKKKNCLSLYYVPVNYILLYINYTSIKKKKTNKVLLYIAQGTIFNIL